MACFEEPSIAWSLSRTGELSASVGFEEAPDVDCLFFSLVDDSLLERFFVDFPLILRRKGLVVLPGLGSPRRAVTASLQIGMLVFKLFGLQNSTLCQCTVYKMKNFCFSFYYINYKLKYSIVYCTQYICYNVIVYKNSCFCCIGQNLKVITAQHYSTYA